MKKTLSVILSVILALTMLSTGITAFADDNTVSTAYAYTVGSRIQMQFNASTYDFERYYKFTAPASNFYTFEIENPYYDSNDGDYQSSFTIYDVKGECIDSGDTNEFTGTCTRTVKLNKGAVYYIEIDNFADENYTLFFKSYKHTHNLDVDSYPAEVDGKYYYSGYYSEECDDCDYYSYRNIAAVKSIKLSATAYVYDGKTHKPSVTVKDTNNKTVSAANYTVTYAKGQKNVGKYSVKVTFKGKYYEGSQTLTYRINPKGTSISSVSAKSKGFKVNWKKQATQTSGYEVRYATSSNMKGAKTVAISKNSTTSKTVSKLKGKKKYYVQVRTYKKVGNTKYYSGWTKAKSVTTKK